MNAVTKKYLFWLLYPAYLAVFFVAVIYLFFWLPFVGDIRDLEKPESSTLATVAHVDHSTMKLLGHVQSAKKSSFVNFHTTKRKGVTRLCAFGDSHTYGEETGATEDYPTLLEQLFHRRGADEMEVLNFGSPGWGIHQSYTMWDLVGQKFECNGILIGPSGFHANRDTSFSHFMLHSPYYHLHSRYIIDGNDVRRIDPMGETHEERFDNYFRFIPRWRYLRYDRNLPPVIQSLLPAGRTLPNVLYYHEDSAWAEAAATYRILLRKIAEHGLPVIVGQTSDRIVDLVKQMEIENLTGFKLYRPKTFPYVAPRGHDSLFGNRLVAKQYYMEIEKQSTRTLDILQTRKPERVEVATGQSERRALSSYDRVEVRLGDLPIGFFVTDSVDQMKRGQGSPVALKRREILAFLAIKNPQASLLDACFLPLSFMPNGSDARIVFRVSGLGSGSEDYMVGEISLVDPRLNIWQADVEGIKCDERGRLRFGGSTAMPLSSLTKDGGNIQGLVGGQEVIEVQVGQAQLRLKPIEGTVWRLRVADLRWADAEPALNANDHFTLVLSHPEDGSIEVSMGKFYTVSVEVGP